LKPRSSRVLRYMGEKGDSGYRIPTLAEGMQGAYIVDAVFFQPQQGVVSAIFIENRRPSPEEMARRVGDAENPELFAVKIGPISPLGLIGLILGKGMKSRRDCHAHPGPLPCAR
jgi:hypothetical protein